MTSKEAYQLSWMWHRAKVSERISVIYWEYMASVFKKHGFEKQWIAADNSLRALTREELS